MLLLEGFANREAFDLARKLDLELVVHQASQLHMLQQHGCTQRQLLWMKIDTGMNRLGFPVEDTAVNTAALMASGIVLVLTWFAFRRDPRLARIPLLISLGLGAFFVLFQGAEWVALLGEGLTMTSSTYGAFFYLIVGAHGLHALGALIALGWTYARLDRGTLTGHQLATVSAFWYFVVLVWPVLYWRVYL